MLNGVRKVERSDIGALKEVLNSIDLFPSDMLDDMIADYFNKPKSTAIWLTSVVNSIPVSIAYCAPEQLTEGTYNLYALGVKSEMQGKGIGEEMMNYLENLLTTMNQRILIIETSGAPSLELTRTFYLKCNYTKEAVIRDFWQEGEDKVIFWKKLITS